MAEDSPTAALLTPEAVRERSHELFDLGLDNRLQAWVVQPEAMAATADLVAEVVRTNHPDLKVPYHARTRHFMPDGAETLALIAAATSDDPAALLRAQIDLTVVSVLLDAGAGMAWRYRDAATGKAYARSEGLAMASLAMFADGAFADDGTSPRADAARLRGMTAEELGRGLQVGPDNPLTGLEGRAALLRRLGETLAATPAVFARVQPPRPSGLVDALAGQLVDGALPARAILIALLRHLGPIWPGRETLDGVNLGDCWRHHGIHRADASAGLIPFHKLSQWLTYSLVEPLEAAGIPVTGIDALTGLPEYRNGGLFLDMGVIRPRDPAVFAAEHAPGDILVVEWRALTVALLDAIAPMVRARLALTAEDFPLARVLEGGTWWAGRRLAQERRADGGPPLRIVSDGTVF
ncbi:URC4/urg3 family protein [Dankookia sp. GCM10030260]|uniref:URC4/urg3 family protein n=1 Tax=Dankookia sp. GCM10030260 TaxID=3273390 RepID=UPI00360B5D64